MAIYDFPTLDEATIGEMLVRDVFGPDRSAVVDFMMTCRSEYDAAIRFDGMYRERVADGELTIPTDRNGHQLTPWLFAQYYFHELAAGSFWVICARGGIEE